MLAQPQCGRRARWARHGAAVRGAALVRPWADRGVARGRYMFKIHVGPVWHFHRSSLIFIAPRAIAGSTTGSGRWTRAMTPRRRATGCWSWNASGCPKIRCRRTLGGPRRSKVCLGHNYPRAALHCGNTETGQIRDASSFHCKINSGNVESESSSAPGVIPAGAELWSAHEPALRLIHTVRIPKACAPATSSIGLSPTNRTWQNTAQTVTYTVLA